MIHVMKHGTAHTPTILFGAFDRHNFGDLLFPHIVAALLEGENLVFAGLAERDLRSHGGHRVHALARLASKWGDRAVNFVHVGGEVLTCDALQAAVMLLTPQQAQIAVARLDNRPEEFLAWARGQLGIPDLAPYTLSRQQLPTASCVIYAGVGGVDLEQADPALRTEVLVKLKSADAVGVRDELTLAQLGASGITATLMPDPAATVAELFGDRIRRRALQGPSLSMRDAFPQGYVAVQFSADFGDDSTLTRIAAQLDRVSSSCGYGVVLFRAGAAPWHDDTDCYRRLSARMQASSVRIFPSLDVWDICALIAHCRAYCGSSLHGRIVATAFALPRVSLLRPDQLDKPSKQVAYAQTWESAGMPHAVGVEAIAQGIVQALAQDRTLLATHAKCLSSLYRDGFEKLRRKLA